MLPINPNHCTSQAIGHSQLESARCVRMNSSARVCYLSIPRASGNGDLANGVGGIEWVTLNEELLGPFDIDTWACLFAVERQFSCLLLPGEDVLDSDSGRFVLVLRVVEGRADHFTRVGILGIAKVDWDNVYKDNFLTQPFSHSRSAVSC